MKRPYRYVLRSYPDSYRDQHGEELAQTALALATRRWSWRQSRSLLAGGIRTRACLATDSSVSGAWASGARTALFLLMAIAASTPLGLKLNSEANYSTVGSW